MPRNNNSSANAGVTGNSARPGKSISPSIKPPANSTASNAGTIKQGGQAGKQGQPVKEGGQAGKVISTSPNTAKPGTVKSTEKPLTGGPGKPGGIAKDPKTSAVSTSAGNLGKPGAVAAANANGSAGKAHGGKKHGNIGTKVNNAANKTVAKVGSSAPASNIASGSGRQAGKTLAAGQGSKQNWSNHHNNWNQHCANHYHHHWYRGSSFAFRPWFYPYFGFGLGYGGWGYPGLGIGLGYGYGGYGYGGYGFSPWGFNLLAYRWGYSPYYNPYCSSYSYPYNYSQPVIINYSATPSTALEPAVASDLDAARNAFKAGDYAAAIDSADLAIKATPDDPTAHELRALALFALGRYEEAAAGLNSLLAVAPGWNWETMLGMYPDVATYTKQLRSLEAFVRENPDSAAGNFVLGYHYLVTNYTDAARKKLQRVVDLEPKDRIAAQLLKGLDDKAAPPVTAEDGAPSDAETDIAGSWSARQGDAQLKLSINDDGTFTWIAPAGKEERTITGKYTLAGNVLVLEAESGDTMVAKVTAIGADKFHFRFVGGPGDDPGLDFERTMTDTAKPPAPPEPPAPPAPAVPDEVGKEL